MTLVNLILVKSDLATLQRNKKIRIYHSPIIPSRYHMIHSESFRIRELVSHRASRFLSTVIYIAPADVTEQDKNLKCLNFSRMSLDYEKLRCFGR